MGRTIDITFEEFPELYSTFLKSLKIEPHDPNKLSEAEKITTKIENLEKEFFEESDKCFKKFSNKKPIPKDYPSYKENYCRPLNMIENEMSMQNILLDSLFDDKAKKVKTAFSKFRSFIGEKTFYGLYSFDNFMKDIQQQKFNSFELNVKQTSNNNIETTFSKSSGFNVFFISYGNSKSEHKFSTQNKNFWKKL